MKKVLSAILITILAYSVIFATAVFAASNIAIQTNSDYTANKTAESKDFATTVGSKIQLYVRLISSGEVGGNPLKTGVQWETSNVQVVAISETGLITALKAGTSTITAKYDGGQDTIKVTVGTGTPSTDVPGQDENTTSGGGSSSGGSSQDENTTSGGESGSGSGSESGSGSGSESGGSSSGGTAVAEWANAKYSLVRDGNWSLNLEVSGGPVFDQDDDYRYYGVIKSNNTKPVVDGQNIDGEKYSDIAFSLTYDNEKKVYRAGSMAKYAELNQDLYLSIVRIKLSNTDGTGNSVMASGIKLERPTLSKYSDAFTDYNMCTYSSDIICPAFIHYSEYDRKMQIKIGKITDISILQKIQNQNVNGFADLLNYAKSSSAMYDKVVDTEKNSTMLEYTAGENYGNTLIDLKNVEDKAYYYLYVKTDSENGKYVSNEAVTLAQASVPINWFLFFYGSSDFQWTDWGTDGNGVLNGNLTKDPTIPDGKLPQTGVSEGILAMIAATAILTGISFVVYSKNRDLR